MTAIIPLFIISQHCRKSQAIGSMVRIIVINLLQLYILRTRKTKSVKIYNLFIILYQIGLEKSSGIVYNSIEVEETLFQNPPILNPPYLFELIFFHLQLCEFRIAITLPQTYRRLLASSCFSLLSGLSEQSNKNSAPKQFEMLWGNFSIICYTLYPFARRLSMRLPRICAFVDETECSRYTAPPCAISVRSASAFCGSGWRSVIQSTCAALQNTVR